MVTADHGNDPKYKGTDHTGEHVLVLLCGGWPPMVRDPGRPLGGYFDSKQSKHLSIQ